VPHIHVHPGPRGEWQLYGGRFAAHVPVRATITPAPDDRDPLSFRVVMNVDIVDGRLACTALTAERLDDASPPITGDELRRIPVGSYVERIALKGSVLQERARLNANVDELVDFQPPPADFTENGMTDEALEQIARVYAAAQATGRKPSGVLLTEYGLNRATSSRWLAVARRRGILVEDHRQVMREPDPAEETTAEERAELEEISKQMTSEEGLPIGPPPDRPAHLKG
jgi:hypothetical protein